ncbi:DUF1275 domain-containing protein [Lactococcus piscium]|uniref:YoaK family protein n=1 Tax=Pseudolactococcus carnosus TaxID=2749961 RepID=UPI001FB8C781|nr:DUF1275 domain-containing protein [Lactococcus carnosus]
MNSKQYRIFERVRVAILLAFISGFVDAYTFMTQGQRFAGMQTGNMIYLMKHLAEGHILTAASYLLPIVAFMLGSLFTYFARRFAVRHKQLRWHSLAGVIIFMGILYTAVISQYVSSQWTVLSLSFIAAVQLESFRKMRGAPYTNTMMTGNLKNMTIFITQGLVEKNEDVLKRGGYIFLVISGFCLGVFLSTVLSIQFSQHALYAILPVVLGFNIVLYKEKRDIIK